jgi:hypothetical protein
MNHGHAKPRGGKASPTYNTWVAMVQRCTNPKHKHYERYGGRGVKVCDRWLKFDAFLDDMGIRPDGLTLDRFPNKDGSYEPSNCRWADSIGQQSNRCNNHILVIEGQSKTVAQWSRDFNIDAGVVRSRLRIGWDPMRALTTQTKCRKIISSRVPVRADVGGAVAL